jgi:hypothetical protein
MNATRVQVTWRRRSPKLGRCSVPSVEDPETEDKVSEEVEQKGELQPPDLVQAVHLLLPSLDPRQVERKRPREKQDVWVRPEKQEEQHAGSVSQHGRRSNPWDDEVGRTSHNRAS